METKYITFSRARPSKSGKTKIWSVLAYNDSFSLTDKYSIGEVRWHGAWRRYAMAPAINTIFEQDCLRKIADFCEKETKKLRLTWKQRKAK